MLNVSSGMRLAAFKSCLYYLVLVTWSVPQFPSDNMGIIMQTPQETGRIESARATRQWESCAWALVSTPQTPASSSSLPVFLFLSSFLSTPAYPRPHSEAAPQLGHCVSCSPRLWPLRGNSRCPSAVLKFWGSPYTESHWVSSQQCHFSFASPTT